MKVKIKTCHIQEWQLLQTDENTFFRIISSILDHFSYRVDRKWCVGVPQVQFEVGRVPIESKGKNWRRRGNSWVAINPTPCALWLSKLVLEFQVLVSNDFLNFRYQNVASSRLSPLVAHSRIFRLFMKGKFDTYVW